MPSWAFWVPLIVRAFLVLSLPQTFFQPDEFYQALEPAHHLVFGYGHLTWEWRDLPPSTPDHGWYGIVSGGRMRSWIWPSVFAAVFKVLQVLHLDSGLLITLAPRMIGIIIAALTDFYTSRLAGKLLGPGASAPALFLSLTSLFNAHLLPRALSTSPETLLTTMALYYFPLDLSVVRRLQPRLQDKEKRDASLDSSTNTQPDPHSKLDYVKMDRLGAPYLRKDRLAISAFLASLAICIRPTTAVFWAFLGLDLVARCYHEKGARAALHVILTAATISLATIALSCGLDFAITKRFYIAAFTFVHQNIFRNLSAFYGATDKSYHLTQSIPILLFPIWWWSGKGFLSCVMPTSMLAPTLANLDRPDAMRTLSRTTVFSFAALSLSPHSEWRFLHPWLPPLLIFAIPALTKSYVPTMVGCYRFSRSFRQYTRIPSRPFYLILLAPVVPYLYLNSLHGRAQVSVMDALRAEGPAITDLVALMPCHSTPWMSHLHRNVDGWFLTCEPPVGSDPVAHVTQQAMFYEKPVTYLRNVFPYPPALLHDIAGFELSPTLPSHIILFGELLSRQESNTSVAQVLSAMGYTEVWNRWNGFDLLQDEPLRRGGVRIWKQIR